VGLPGGDGKVATPAVTGTVMAVVVEPAQFESVPPESVSVIVPAQPVSTTEGKALETTET
jgi:hypothetical protein